MIKSLTSNTNNPDQSGRDSTEALLTIIVPVHNESAWLDETIDSIQAQTLSNFKVLIGDNASNDGSREIIAKAAQKHSNIEFVLRPKNIGAVANIADLVKRCSTRYLAFIGAHDLVDRDWAITLTGLLQASPNLSLAYSRVAWIDSHGLRFKETDGGEFVRFEETPLTRYTSCIAHKWGECTAVNGVFRASVFKDFWFPKVNGPDHILLARASYHGKIARIERSLYFRREFERDTTYADRISGAALIKISRGMNPTIAAFAIDFLVLEGAGFFNPFKFTAFYKSLSKGYGQRTISSNAFTLLYLVYFAVVASLPMNRVSSLDRGINAKTAWHSRRHEAF
jgi:glycosyltransferase involved in cell wall biosynthesis